MERERIVRIRHNLLNKPDPDRMDRNRPCIERQRSVAVRPLGELFRHIRILDHLCHAIDITEHPDLLIPRCLGDHLGTELARAVLSKRMKPEEHRIDHHRVRVIDLEIAHVLDAAILHIRQCPRDRQRLERPAMPIGVRRQVHRIAHQNLAGRRIEARHHALLEELHIPRIEPEEIMLREERPSRLMIQRRGHDVPRDHRTILLLRSENPLRKDLKQWLAIDARCRITPLGAFIAQSTPLPTCDRKTRDLRRPDQLFALGFEPGSIPIAIQAVVFRRLNRPRRSSGGIVVHILFDHGSKLIQINLTELGCDRIAGRPRSHFGEVLHQMMLVAGFELGTQIGHRRHG